MHHSPTIGLLGGVASGKTTVARMFGRLGAVVIDADQIAHDVLDDADVAASIRQEWGDGVLRADGRVDRRALGQVVFEDSARTQRLNAIVHPPVLRAMRAQMEHARRNEAAAIVVDAALLVEAGFQDDCGLLVFVETPESRRRALSETHRGWGGDEVAKREAHQTPLARKRELAHHLVRNDGTQEQLWRQVQALWERIVGTGTP